MNRRSKAEVRELNPRPSFIPGGLPRKERMEEARLVVCPECGCAAGRHLQVCSRRETSG